MNAMPTSPQPLSVLQLRSSSGLYGADRMVLTLNQALAGAGARSRLLNINNYRMREQALHDAARQLGQETGLLHCGGRFDPRTVQALVAEIDRTDADVLHVHDYKSAFYAWLASRRRRPLLVATLHGWVDHSQSLRLYTRLELVLLRRFDALVVVASEQVKRLAEAGIPHARIHQVDNAFATLPEPPGSGDCESAAALRDTLGLPMGAFVFAAVARLSPEKNIPLLLDAFHAIATTDPAPVLLIVGDGPQREALEAQTRRLGIGDRVHFAGMRNDMERIYPLIDRLVLSSLNEGMPLVVLEAMMHAIPIIASAVGDVPRLLANTEHGQLVAAGDVHALRTAMQAAANMPGLRDTRARTHALLHHSPAMMASRYLGLYRSELANAHGRKTA